MDIYYHGSHNGNTTAHLGICLTSDYRAAKEYAGDNGTIIEVQLDLSGLVVAEVDGYDHDSNEAPGDDGDNRGADVLAYDDEDERGREHDTIRLMTGDAVCSVVSVSVID